MEKIEFSYNIPTSKKDIILEDWMKFEKIVSQEDVEEDFIQKKMLEIFCGVPNEYSTKLKQVQVDEILYHLNLVLGSKPELTKTFTFNGKKYALIPDFENDITAGELIDLDRYLEDKDYSRLLSILYRPISFEKSGLYQIEPYSGTHTDFLKLSYDIFEGVLSFFLTLYEKLAQVTLKYTLNQVKKLKMKDTDYQEKVNLLKNGELILKSFGFYQMGM